jgi:hypothetical protein
MFLEEIASSASPVSSVGQRTDDRPSASTRQLDLAHDVAAGALGHLDLIQRRF